MDDSLFVSAEIAEKTIRLSDGSKHVFHFRHLDNVAWEVYAAQVNSADANVAGAAAARLLSQGLVTADGKQALPYDRVVLLRRPVFRAMFAALLEVNTYGAQVVASETKSSEPGASTGSGSPSRSRSAAGRSRNGKGR